MIVRDFRIDVPQAEIEELRRRLRAARWPTALDPGDWQDGTSVSFLRELVDAWLDRFSWREQEARLNRLPQFLADIDGATVHFVHRRGIGPAPLPIILTHGWPGSFVEMEAILPLLADPGAHGGDPADAFHVVVPSLPGYAFSRASDRREFGSRGIAGLWRSLMAGLGYAQFVAQGGDIGAGVSLWLARDHPESVRGVHLNYVPAGLRPWLGRGSAPVTAEERSFLDSAARFAAEEGAYAALHATRPQTLAFALSDSPIGLAAWMSEKFRAWSDNDGDLRTAIPLAVVLANISLHWFSGNVGASLGLYKANRHQPLAFAAGELLDPPLGVAIFPRELPMPPRSWVERVAAVARWTEMPAGGHFAALEQPAALASEIRAFCRPLRAR